MDNLEIIVSDSTIYNNICRIYGQNFIDNYDEFLTFSMKWVSRNAEVLGSKNLGKRVTFYDADENEIFRIFNVDKKVISEIVKKSTYVDKKWQISTRPLNVLQYVLIFFYLANHKQNIHNKYHIGNQLFQQMLSLNQTLYLHFRKFATL